MELEIETDKGWTEAIIDSDCEYVKFYRIADVLTDDLDLKFIRELEDFQSIYKDFDFKGSRLSLHYNIYLGVSIFPVSCKNSSALDNERVKEIGQLLFSKMIDFDWEPFENGSTLGQPGSEGGQTVVDLENLKGARITSEELGESSFAITLGIYGMMMHTHYESEPDKADAYVTQSKFKINKIIDMYDVEAEKRDDYWQTKLYKMIDDLAEMTGLEPKAVENQVLPVRKVWWKKLLGI